MNVAASSRRRGAGLEQGTLLTTLNAANLCCGKGSRLSHLDILAVQQVFLMKLYVIAVLHLASFTTVSKLGALALLASARKSRALKIAANVPPAAAIPRIVVGRESLVAV